MNPPTTGKASLVGVGADLWFGFKGKTIGFGYTKMDFDMNGTTDGHGVYWYSSKSGFGLQASAGVEVAHSFHNDLKGTATEVGGGAALSGTVGINKNTAILTVGAGAGLGAHSSTNKTGVFVFY